MEVNQYTEKKAYFNRFRRAVCEEVASESFKMVFLEYFRVISRVNSTTLYAASYFCGHICLKTSYLRLYLKLFIAAEKKQSIG
jgi:hypothetical protein